MLLPEFYTTNLQIALSFTSISHRYIGYISIFHSKFLTEITKIDLKTQLFIVVETISICINSIAF